MENPSNKSQLNISLQRMNAVPKARGRAGHICARRERFSYSRPDEICGPTVTVQAVTKHQLTPQYLKPDAPAARSVSACFEHKQRAQRIQRHVLAPFSRLDYRVLPFLATCISKTTASLTLLLFAAKREQVVDKCRNDTLVLAASAPEVSVMRTVWLQVGTSVPDPMEGNTSV